MRSLFACLAGLALTLSSSILAETPETPPDVKAPPSDALKSESGFASKVLKAGHGTRKPILPNTVTVNYSGWTTNGKLFDSSVQRGQPASLSLNSVTMSSKLGLDLIVDRKFLHVWIPAAIAEGLQLMVEGEKRRFWIPAHIAYGYNPKGNDGRPGGMLVFDVELLAIKEPPETLTAPEDITKVPDSAEKTLSGLASRVLEKGTGTTHPHATDTVKINYSVWTADSNLFYSSVQRGQPQFFDLNHTIRGLTEGIQLMVVGEKRRFWIPAKLAYGDNPGKGLPCGMLLYDVELLEYSGLPEKVRTKH